MITPSETRISIPRSQTITHEVTKTRNSQPEIEESRKVVGGKYSIEGRRPVLVTSTLQLLGISTLWSN